MSKNLTEWLAEQQAASRRAASNDPTYDYWYAAGETDYSRGFNPTIIDVMYQARLQVPGVTETKISKQAYRDGLSHASITDWLKRVNGESNELPTQPRPDDRGSPSGTPAV